jgi:acyl carrier protein
MTKLEQTVAEIIAKELKLDQTPDLNTNLLDLNTDSLDRAEIIFSIEDEFGIELRIPDKQTAVEIFKTVQSVADFVQKSIDNK